MISINIESPGEISLKDYPIPEISGEEVLLKVKYVGFCGSDLNSFLGRNPMVKYPIIPGHEVAGSIIRKGTSVPNNLEEGQAVTVIPYTSCGTCASCKRGRPNACRFNQTLGVQRDGAMSEYISVPWKKILPGKGLTMEELAFTEPLTVGFHAVERGRVSENDFIAVLGCGIIGIGAIISSINRKARVIAVDIDDSKLSLARKLGAEITVNTTKEDLRQCLSEINGGMGPDVVIEAAGQAATYLAAIDGVSFTGRVVCIGYAKDDISFATKLFVQKELDIMGSRNACPEDFENVMEYLRKGRLPLKDLISMKVRPEGAFSALKKWVENPGEIFKILLEF